VVCEELLPFQDLVQITDLQPEIGHTLGLNKTAAVFAGKDASRALAKTSTKLEDVSPEWKDLDDKEKSTLNDWNTFFSKRYNVVGKVEGATNME
jgi:hypothetical protein